MPDMELAPSFEVYIHQWWEKNTLYKSNIGFSQISTVFTLVKWKESLDECLTLKFKKSKSTSCVRGKTMFGFWMICWNAGRELLVRLNCKHRPWC